MLGSSEIFLISILDLYERCSGQVINKTKSVVMFSVNAAQNQREEVMTALEIERETMNDKYLGLPVYVGQSKQNIFSYLKDRVWNRIQGWKEKLL